MRKIITTSATLLSICLAGLSIAFSNQSGQQPNPHAGHSEILQKDTSISTKEFIIANDKMHKDMNILFSGDADTDFIKGMIPHHQGAIDMAKVVLKHGKDAETKKLAMEIIAAQEKEILFMNEWLTRKLKK